MNSAFAARTTRSISCPVSLRSTGVWSTCATHARTIYRKVCEFDILFASFVLPISLAWCNGWGVVRVICALLKVKPQRM